MKYALRILIGLILMMVVVFIMSRMISWQDASESLRALRWTSVALIVSVVLVMGLLKATRFFFILRFGGIPVSWPKTVRIFMASQAFTAFPAGELGRAMLFKKELDVHLKEVAGPVFLQALLELWTAALWVVCAAFFVGGLWGWWLTAGLLVLLAVLTTPLLLSTRFPLFFDFLKKHGMTYVWIEKTQATFRQFEKLVSSGGKTKAWRFWLIVIGLGLLAHGLGGALMWYVSQTVGAHLTPLQGIYSATLGVLIQGVLSVIPGGLGVTEGGLAGILSGFAVPWQKTLVIILLYRLATLVLPIVIALFFLVALTGKNILRKITPASS